MDMIRINGCPPYDGDYEADLTRFTNGELRTIKKESGIVASKLQDALLDGDQDAFVALTIVMLQRSGKFPTVVPQLLWDAPADALEFIPDNEDEVDASAEGNSPTPSEPPSPPAASSEPGGATPTSGGSSTEPSELPPPTPLRTGTQG
jgi:hypothetical protein